ncbi:MAG: hypothetical protein LLF95_02675 [Bacteroidales bacterium]|nr:hypothetical protein [Bacteroidales bacterium]
MYFTEGNIYYLFNQGNNLEKIFFNDENKKYFLTKIRKHILPYADILAWCLMPNHFHLMLYVNCISLAGSDALAADTVKNTFNVIMPTNRSVSSVKSVTPTPANVVKVHCSKEHTLSYSIGIMLSSYSQAVNKQQNRTGSLFRNNTKAECITACNEITPSFFNTTNGVLINRHFTEDEYPKVCFDYIHNNPVKAGFVKSPEEWEFSSFRDVYGLRNGNLINRNRIEEFHLK